MRDRKPKTRIGTPGRTGRFVGVAHALLFGVVLAAGDARAAPVTLTLLLVETPAGAPTEARVSVTGPDASPCRPFPDSACLFQDRLGGYFYADSAAGVEVETGRVRVRAAKGPEFLPVDLTLTLGADTTVVVSLERWIDPRTSGWVSGDTHGHLTHPPVVYAVDGAEALRVMRAEGLRVATFLENGSPFTGAVEVLSDTSAVFFAGEEYRSPVFGHLGLLGIDTLITPQGAQMGWPPNTPVFHRVSGHTHALAVYAHPHTTCDYFAVEEFPGTGLARALWVDAALGAVAGLDVLSYSNLAAPGYAADSLWTHLWNAGFMVPGLAGTDGGLASGSDFPIGGLRAYVRVADPWASPQDLYDAWVEGARRGRTFVTTGPLLTGFDVGGAGAGETLHAPAGMPLDVAVRARFESTRRLGRVEIIRNGAVVRTFQAGGAHVIDVSASVSVRETSWIAVRHDDYAYDDFHPTTRSFAQPTPVLVLFDGDGLTSPASASHALGRIDLLDSLLSQVAQYPSSEESVEVAEGIAQARAAWSARSNAPPAPFHLEAPGYACLVTDSIPTFHWGNAVDPDTTGTLKYRLILARDPDFEDVLASVSELLEATWTPGAPLEIGRRYWWRVCAEEGGGEVRWAEEIDWWFEPATATGTPSAGGASPVFFAPSPNPSGPALGDVVFSWLSPRGAPCTVSLYDPAGRLVRALVTRPGTGSVVWDARDGEGRAVPGGVYLYRMAAETGVRTGKICVVR